MNVKCFTACLHGQQVGAGFSYRPFISHLHVPILSISLPATEKPWHARSPELHCNQDWVCLSQECLKANFYSAVVSD